MIDHALSAQTTHTGALLQELALVGYRPGENDIDPRPLPEAAACHQAMCDVFDALGHAFNDTRLEPDLEEVLWGVVNVFHRKIRRLDDDLDRNELAQRDSQSIQDGSEIKSVELEHLTAMGVSLIERRNSFEALRDIAADLYGRQIGSAWLPSAGSKVNRAALTASMIDSRDFMNARRRADTMTLAPSGPMIAFVSGVDYNDHDAIWSNLDKVLTKHPDMVLAHTGDKTGGAKIASCWATSRNVPQIAFAPNFTRDGKAAPFKRNDRILDSLPIGVIAGPGEGGVRNNLVDKAQRRGIPVLEIK